MASEMRVVLAVALSSVACTAEFLVGDATGTTTVSVGGPVDTGTPTTLVETTHGATTTTGVGSDSAATSTTTDATGTHGSGEGATTTGAVDPTTGAHASTGDPTGGVSPFDDCFGAGALDCVELPQCDLFGSNCWADPCHPDAADACAMQEYAGCNEAPNAVCVWDGPMVGGACHFSPCTALPFGDCGAQQGCVWDGDMDTGMCVFADCPACWELGADGCDLTPGCRWFPAQMSCAPDPI